MTTATLGSAPSIGFANVARSEWTKLRSVRSTYWTMVFAVAGSVVAGAILAVTFVARIADHPYERFGFDPTTFSLNGLYIAQVAFGALGVLIISSEYGTGMIRTTFAAVPQRRAVLAAKALVFATTALVAGEILSFAAFGIGQAILSGQHLGASLGDPQVLRAVVGGGLYLTAIGLLGFGIGALVRHTAGALSTLFAVLFAGSVIVELLPTSWRNDVLPYMPLNAGGQIMTVVRSHDSLAPWTGFGFLCLYAAAFIAAATFAVVRRDA